MLSSLLPILPSLGLLMIIVLGYFIFRTKVHEYNQKFSSMFSLLSAMTDEIKKLKQMKTIEHNDSFIPIEVDNSVVNDENESEYSTEDECISNDEVDESGYQHDNEDDEDDHEDDEDDEDNYQLKNSISNNVLLGKNEPEQDEPEEQDNQDDIVSYNDMIP